MSLLLQYHLARCQFPPVLFDPNHDAVVAEDEAKLLRRLVELIAGSWEVDEEVQGGAGEPPRPLMETRFCSSIGFASQQFCRHDGIMLVEHAMTREELLTRISIDPRICFGKPCIRGHRIWVSLILDLLASGMSTRDILEQYPGLEEPDILACIAYGAEMSSGRFLEIA